MPIEKYRNYSRVKNTYDMIRMLPVRRYAASQRQDNQEYFSLILTFRASPAD